MEITNIISATILTTYRTSYDYLSFKTTGDAVLAFSVSCKKGDSQQQNGIIYLQEERDRQAVVT